MDVQISGRIPKIDGMKYEITFTNWEELIIIAHQMIGLRDSKDDRDQFLYDFIMHCMPKQ